MSRKWIIALAALNLLAILIAVSSFMVDFAILAPSKLQYEISNTESVKAAIFQAQSQGIEMMRSSAVSGGIALAFVMILNFSILAILARKKDPKRVTSKMTDI